MVKPQASLISKVQRYFKIRQLPFLKEKGISVLVSCQDDHVTLRDCVESFLGFGDEIIIISNRATRETTELAVSLEKEYSPIVKYIDAHHAVDLYHSDCSQGPHRGIQQRSDVRLREPR